MGELQPLPVLGAEREFHHRLDKGELRAAEEITTLQLNLGLFCNLACQHCHVSSSPIRTDAHENISSETASRVLEWLQVNPGIDKVDLTGGSPEVNPEFKRIVTGARELGLQVMDRCNPTIITYKDANERDYRWIPEFLAENQVEVIASLPCYLEENVRGQRGIGSFDTSIQGLKLLNEVGYGRDPNMRLNLVFNPIGPYLPPPQDSLSATYRCELGPRYGIVFNELWTITNMPIQRWRADLERKGELEDYMALLVESFNPQTVEGLMCRHQIHVDSQGVLHDCDFNYALGLRTPEHEEQRLWDVSLPELSARRIATGNHCYGCTAGCGSSCGGVLV